jgi:hypothetical protein
MRFENAFGPNEIGGTNFSTRNTIAFNAGKGINLATTNISSLQNRINSSNSIFSNGGLGIDLGDDGVTVNDDCDAENGTNNLQNYPIINNVVLVGGNPTYQANGTFNSAPNQDYVLRFYGNSVADPSGFGEGQVFLGSTMVTVPQGCQVSFSAPLPFRTGNTSCVTATSTDSDGNTSEFSQCVPNPTIRRRASDFDGDGLTDISIFRPSNGQWWVLRSLDGSSSVTQFGNLSDVITPGDYTGDGIIDIAFWRPSTGEWFILRSEDSSFFSFPFGSTADIPAPADFDGDGKTDVAVFRPSSSTWFILRSGDGGTTINQFGINTDRPVPADYDGDGKADIAIFRPNGTNNSEWWIEQSSNGGVSVAQFGTSTDKTVQGDYTGDSKADIAVWRPSTGEWFILRSEDFSYFSFPFGVTDDIPAPGDYDGDGKFDATVFRPSDMNWYSNRTTSGILIVNFGLPNDIPVPSAFVR